ncbi:insulinase (Peptidase family M16) [Leucobacter luti]|uniref:Insulinase (Peptidase family M16) n=1 Tax=Leucobacter luti TaxID=340320 RepID=A0A4R6RZ39_9MICO|nr:insulinase (Peptidase family M16) [Leucobacter luti]
MVSDHTPDKTTERHAGHVSLFLGVGSSSDHPSFPGTAHLMEHLLTRQLIGLLSEEHRSSVARLSARTYPDHIEIAVLTEEKLGEELAEELALGISLTECDDARLEEVRRVIQEIDSFASKSLHSKLSAQALRVRRRQPHLDDATVLGFGDPDLLDRIGWDQLRQHANIANNNFLVAFEGHVSRPSDTKVFTNRSLSLQMPAQRPSVKGLQRLGDVEKSADTFSAFSIEIASSFGFDPTHYEAIGIIAHAACKELSLNPSLYGRGRSGAPLAFVGPFGPTRSGQSVELILAGHVSDGVLLEGVVEVLDILGQPSKIHEHSADYEFTKSLTTAGRFGSFIDASFEAFHSLSPQQAFINETTERTQNTESESFIFEIIDELGASIETRIIV